MSGVTTAVIWALPELADESALVAAAPAAGLRIVRRCVDAADLLAHASVDALTTIVVSDGVPRLDVDLARRLSTGGRHVVGVATSEAGLRRLRDWGVTVVVDATDAGDAAGIVARIASCCHDAIPRAVLVREDVVPSSPTRDEPPSINPTRSRLPRRERTRDAARNADAALDGLIRREPVRGERTRDDAPNADLVRDGFTRRDSVRGGFVADDSAPRRTRAARETQDWATHAARLSSLKPRRLFARSRDRVPPVPESSRVVVVVAPPGSPGCSTTAIGVADELAQIGRRVLLVDADVRCPSLALMLGITDETSGLLLAARQADNGLLSARTIVQLARSYRDGLDVLTGLPRPDRRGELRVAALERIWQSAREAYDVVVIDVGAADLAVPDERSLLADEPVDACAQSAAREADGVIVVTRGDALGMSRLSLASARLSAATVLALVDPARHATARAVALVADLGMHVPAERVPWDDAWADALVRGTTLTETKPRSRARRAYQSLAEHVTATSHHAAA